MAKTGKRGTSTKTDSRAISVFQRYRIVSDDDVRVALERTQEAFARVPVGAGRGTIGGTISKS